jgi:hypothetical protein
MRWSPRETDETNREVGAEAVEEPERGTQIDRRRQSKHPKSPVCLAGALQ